MELIRRILQDKISERIEPNKVVLIFGARRVGKTVLMRQILNNYPEKTMLLNGRTTIHWLC
jgi:predicted AAA+ superfamily ATPase